MIHLGIWKRSGSTLDAACGGDLEVSTTGFNARTNIEHVDCPACIDAWETAPQPATTADLADVVSLLRQLAEPAVCDFNVFYKTATDLEARLRRPRRKNSNG